MDRNGARSVPVQKGGRDCGLFSGNRNIYWKLGTIVGTISGARYGMLNLAGQNVLWAAGVNTAFAVEELRVLTSGLGHGVD